MAGTTETYAYDGDGVRFSRTVGAGPAIRAVSDPTGGLPVTIADGSRKHVWGASGLAYTVDGSTLEVVHPDRLGSIRAVTDAAGVVTATFRTDEFGIPTASTGAAGSPFRYTGEPLDASGLTYLRARYYDPSIGRFLSRDPFAGFAAAPLSLNRYSYVHNNPATWTDPSGLTASSNVLSCGGEAHGALDIGGLLFPMADVANAGIYVCEGDWGNAGLSGIGVVPVIGDLLKWIGKSLRIGSKTVIIAERQLQAKFKHATDFGITGPWNNANAQAFREAIEQHVRNAPARRGPSAASPELGIWIRARGSGWFLDEAGNFATGFRFSDQQLLHFPEIGGG